MTAIFTETIYVEYTEWGEYVYFASFAVSLGERAKRTDSVACYVNRIWADDQLIYSASSGKSSFKFKFFPGTTDQGEVFRGMNYRDQMVLVFEGMPLKAFKDRIPVISAEIIDAPEVTTVTATFTPTVETEYDYVELFPRQGLLVKGKPTSILSKLQAYVWGPQQRRYGYAFYQQRTKDRISPPMGFMPDAYINAGNMDNPALIFAYAPALKTTLLQRPNGTKSATVFDLATFRSHFYEGVTEVWQLAMSQDYYVARGQNTPTAIEASPVGGSGGFNFNTGPLLNQSSLMVGGRPDTAIIDFVMLDPYHPNHKYSYHVQAVTDGNTLGFARGRALDDVTEVYSLTASKVYLHSVTFDRRKGISVSSEVVFDAGADNIYQVFPLANADFILVMKDPGSSEGLVLRLNRVGDVRWSVGITAPNSTNLKYRMGEMSADLSGGTLVLRIGNTQTQVTRIDLTTGASEVITIPATPALASSDDIAIWDSRYGCLYTKTDTIIRFDIPDVSSNTLPAIISEFAERAGYSPDDLSFVGLDDQALPGYIITDGDLSNVLDNLALLYNFNYSDEAGVLSVISPYAGNAVNVSVVLETDDLATLTESDGNDHTLARDGENTIPFKIDLDYFDISNEYKQGSESEKRRSFPQRVVESEGVASFSIPVSLTPSEAAERTTAALVRMWNARKGHSIRLNAGYMEAKPGEVFTFDASGVRHTAVVTSKYINADNSLSISLTELADNDYPIELEAQTPLAPAQAVMGMPVNALVVDLPALDPSANPQGRLQAYAVLSPYSPEDWPTFARLDMRELSEGADWRVRYITTDPTPAGAIINELGPVQSPFETDYNNIIQVDLQGIPTDALESATYEEMLAGANLAIIGRNGLYEYIQYGNVEINGNVATLSTLFRGRAGTDAHTNLITGGVFIPLTKIGLIEYPVSAYQAATGYAYRSETPGQSKDELEEKAYYPMGNSRKPFAPNDVKATRLANGDILFTWKRRVRFGGELEDFTGDVELDEDIEAYALDIHNADFTEVVRRVGNIHQPRYVYTLADQIIDEFNTNDVLNTLVFQINPTHVGRGFAGGGAINVVDMDAVEASIIDDDSLTANVSIDTGPPVEGGFITFTAGNSGSLTGVCKPSGPYGTIGTIIDENTPAGDPTITGVLHRSTASQLELTLAGDQTATIGTRTLELEGIGSYAVGDADFVFYDGGPGATFVQWNGVTAPFTASEDYTATLA